MPSNSSLPFNYENWFLKTDFLVEKRPVSWRKNRVNIRCILYLSSSTRSIQDMAEGSNNVVDSHHVCSPRQKHDEVLYM